MFNSSSKLPQAPNPDKVKPPTKLFVAPRKPKFVSLQTSKSCSSISSQQTNTPSHKPPQPTQSSKLGNFRLQKLISKDEENKEKKRVTQVNESYNLTTIHQQRAMQSPQVSRQLKVEKPKNTFFDNTFLRSYRGLLNGLSDDQKKVIELGAKEKSFFFTGAAGTGKSYVMRKLIYVLKSMRSTPEYVHVTASTGIAACNIGGTTLHSFAGIGLGDQNVDALILKVTKNQKACERWRTAEVILIDEISMISGELLDKRSALPFGGIQMIFSGDFFQLPPVSKNSEAKFVFESECWSNTIEDHVILRTQHRQNNTDFISILNNIRFGYVTHDAYKILQSCQQRELTGDKSLLFSHRLDAERMNKQQLERLTEQAKVFRCEESGDEYSRKLLKDCQAPSELVLKKGTLVMLLKNTNPEVGLVNGAVGRVVDFAEIQEKKYKDLKEMKDRFATFCNARQAEKDFYSKTPLFPVVEFEKEKVTVKPDMWEIEADGLIKTVRIQIPLTYAWAISIHKSQGLTLSKAEIHLEKVFESGQAYVALSRIQSLDGLKIQGKIPGSSAWRVNEKVLQFYRSIDPEFKEIPDDQLYFPKHSKSISNSKSAVITQKPDGKICIKFQKPTTN
ncbi:ATP-dependent DNA helicase [Entamoeba marina]